MKIKIIDKSSEVCFDGVFYPTNVELEVETSVALRMSKHVNVYVPKTDKLPYNPDLFQKDKKFAMTTHVDNTSGWGNVSFNLIKYSKDYQISLIGKTFNIRDPLIWKSARNKVDESMAMIWHEQPLEMWRDSIFSKNIAIVPFETTIIPKSWIPRINSMDALFTTCQQNKEAFEKSGVTIPIEVIHWGFEPDLWPYIERPKRDVFTFGTMGALSTRKGTDILVDAFREAFPPDIKDVRLICKTSYNQYPFMVKDPRIIVQMSPVDHDELVNTFVKEIDCFVFPSRGEGFGMPPMEMAASGVPIIVPSWAGIAEYFTEDCGWSIDYGFEDAVDFTKNIYKEECGQWCLPSKEHLVKLLRYVYEHQDEVKEKGKTASKYMHENWTWEKKIKTFHDALEKHL